MDKRLVKKLYEVFKQKNNKYKKQLDKDQQTIKSFEKLFRKPLQDSILDKDVYEPLCNFLNKYVDG